MGMHERLVATARWAVAGGVAAVLLAGAGGLARPAQAQGMQQQALPPGAVRLQRVQIVDPSGFERPMAAATGLIPSGWQTQGGVVWNVKTTCGKGYQFNWSAASPDGAMGLALFPGMQWGLSNYGNGGSAIPGCPALQITNIRDYLLYLVQVSRPGAQVLDFRRRGDLEKDFAQLNSTTPMPMGQIRTWVEGGEVLIGYNEQGRDMRETAAAVVIFNHSVMQGAYQGQAMEYLTAEALPGYAYRAPNGYLDFRLAETIRASFKLTPDWSARINQHNAKIAKTNIDGARKRSQITAKTYEEIRQMNQRSYEERNRVSDRMNREFSEYIRDVETYNDPTSTTGTVELSNQYENAWRLDDGSYVLSDDASFNPYAVYGQGGTRLDRTQ